MKNRTVLIIEDEMRLSNAICKYLEADGFRFLQASSGEEGLRLFEQHLPDLIVLDIMLPDKDGLTICENIRTISDVPIIMLTARIDDEDRLAGFAKGADDYVCKPFNPLELMSRIRAVMRRTIAPTEDRTIIRGPVVLSTEDHRVTVDGVEILLTQSEFSILSVMMVNPTRAFSRQELLTSAHGKYSEFYERAIDGHIKNLRKKLNQSDNHKFVKTVYGVGYKFF